MQKIVLQKWVAGVAAAIVLPALLSGCNIFGNYLSPPEWIIGEWRDKDNGRAIFTENNLVLYGTDFSEQRILDEQSSSNRYTLEVEDTGGEVTYEFTKESSEKILFSNSRQPDQDPTEMMRQ